ncbi:hypothetical protein [Absidia glauca]|uniref:Protein phosphatase 1 regulatory subunit 21 N-terminal domain-containing protein n=1 Tax=Absidia glauca TaxID=4829 RepID=A0A163UUX3_ABSGL|nr:hypothetical protein [Absidia glauca]
MTGVSVEELAQKHQALFQEYSSLKARHTVLKKAVKKERMDNASLQDNVKEKEKELRKLQGQLDILAFHNERLSKRIEAVQEIETKGSHFSLLGGTIKKELEKSTQALDAANTDLARKIEENEDLHAELSEINHVYTDNLNKLYVQIAALEKRIEDLQDERSLLQSETSSQSSVLVKEKDDLTREISRLQDDLSSKLQLLDEYQQHTASNDGAATDLTVTQLKSALEDQAITADQQIKALENDIKGLEDTIMHLKSEHLATSEAANEKTKRLEKQMVSTETLITELRSQQRLDSDSATETRIEALEKDLLNLQQSTESLRAANDTLELEKAALVKDNTSLREDTTGIIDRLTEEVRKKKELLDTMEQKIVYLEKQLEEQQQQISLLQEHVASYENALTTKDSDAQLGHDNSTHEDEHQPFVYPAPTEELAHGGGGSGDDDHSDVATSSNGTLSEAPKTNKANTSGDGGDNNQTQDGLNMETIIQDRENKLKQYYESRVNQLTEKLQVADSKAKRFADLVGSLKDKLIEENETKQGLCKEIVKLKEEVVKAKESLSTTESKYQEQLDMLTEYTTSLQMEVSKAQTRSPT